MVKSLPLRTVKWLVIVVVIYTAITMLYSAYAERLEVTETAAARSQAR